MYFVKEKAVFINLVLSSVLWRYICKDGLAKPFENGFASFGGARKFIAVRLRIQYSAKALAVVQPERD